MAGHIQEARIDNLDFDWLSRKTAHWPCVETCCYSLKVKDLRSCCQLLENMLKTIVSLQAYSSSDIREPGV